MEQKEKKYFLFSFQFKVKKFEIGKRENKTNSWTDNMTVEQLDR